MYKPRRSNWLDNQITGIDFTLYINFNQGFKDNVGVSKKRK